MKRRDFLKTALIAPAVWSCGKAKEDKPKQKSSALLQRSSLLRMDGIVSIHDHIDSMKAADLMIQAMDRAGISRMNLLGAYESLLHGTKPDFSTAAKNNATLLEAVRKYPKRFTAFALVDGHEPDLVEAARDYINKGVRGFKMYNGTANAYRQMPLTSKVLQPFFAFCETHGIPVLIHVDQPNLDEFLEVVRDYPHIPWICPHLFVQTSPNKIARMGRIFRKYPNLMTDMSFGFEGWMHANLTALSKSRDRVREIFIEHADQICFGTDIVFAVNQPYRTADWAANSFEEYRKFLEFESFDHNVKTAREAFKGRINGLALPEQILKKIYVENPALILDGLPILVNEDDLDRVAIQIPKDAVPDAKGELRLFAVAAVASLSQRETMDLNSTEETIAVTEPLASAVKTAFPSAKTKIFDTSESLKNAVAADSDLIGIIPFGELEPRLRALSINGIDPALPGIHRTAAARQSSIKAYFGDYPLLFPMKASAEAASEVRFDPHEIRTVTLTGGSLLGQGMVDEPTLSPKEVVSGVADLLRISDIAHVSIENVLRNPCKQNLDRWGFCYDDPWLEVLDRLGVDVIELTGNHLRDFGPKATTQTMVRYKELGYPLFGGGVDVEKAMDPAVIAIRGLKIGFTGINRLNGKAFAAAENAAGPLIDINGNFAEALRRTREKSDLFFFTYQGGYEFSPTPWNDMVSYAHRAVDAGAVGAVGVHAHAPMGVEVYNRAFIGYGLGNFLFRHPKKAIPHSEFTFKAVVFRTTLYQNRLLQTKVVPIEMQKGAVSISGGETAQATLARVREASRPSLAPERPLADFADSCLSIGSENGMRNLFVVIRKLGLSGVLAGFDEPASEKAGSYSNASEQLHRAADQFNEWNYEGMRLCLPVFPGDTLPKEGYDALRIFVGNDTDGFTSRMTSALSADKPIQLIFKSTDILEDVMKRVSGVKDVPILFSGLGILRREYRKLGELLSKRPNVFVDTASYVIEDLTALATAVTNDTDRWASFFKEFQSRLLLGSGTAPARKMGPDQHYRVLRAWRLALEEARFRMPLLEKGNMGEWNGYPYEKEPWMKGLGLPVPVVDAVAGKNFEMLWK